MARGWGEQRRVRERLAPYRGHRMTAPVLKNGDSAAGDFKLEHTGKAAIIGSSSVLVIARPALDRQREHRWGWPGRCPKPVPATLTLAVP
jgi:hypothetical protein